MKCRVPDQETDQKGLGERWCKKDRQARKLNRKFAMDRSRWRKQIKMVDQDRCEWVNVNSGTGSSK